MSDTPNWVAPYQVIYYPKLDGGTGPILEDGSAQARATIRRATWRGKALSQNMRGKVGATFGFSQAVTGCLPTMILRYAYRRKDPAPAFFLWAKEQAENARTDFHTTRRQQEVTEHPFLLRKGD